MQALAVTFVVLVSSSLLATVVYALVFVVTSLRKAFGARHDTPGEELDRVLAEILGARGAPASPAGHGPTAGDGSPSARGTIAHRL